MKNKRFIFFARCGAIVVFLLLMAGGVLSAQDFTVDYRYNYSGPDGQNYLTYKSAIRYIAAEKDAFDAGSGASKQKSTSLFAPIQTDIMGRATISTGFRGLLLFPLSADSTRTEDNLHIYAEGGIVTAEYAHRGVAYRIQTDKTGNISFPRGNFVMRTIGYIQGTNPQVISRDFSTDGTANTIDWKKVWDPATPSGRPVATGNNAVTGPIQNDFGDMMAMFNWDGTLAVQFLNSTLTITGTLRPVKR
ncbi:MAG: hypothetical protein LBT39_02080 [Treponema sp.]|jgi:hypothetical protein|nr:hypothetical protein [Treponema sp.]